MVMPCMPLNVVFEIKARIKSRFGLFSHPPGGLRGLNFVASKRYHLRNGPKFLNKNGII